MEVFSADISLSSGYKIPIKEQKMKKNLSKMLKAALIAAAAVIVFSIVGLLLAVFNVVNAEPWKLCLLILIFGLALVFLVYGVVVKGGYETAVALMLAMIGATILLIPVIKWWVILVDVLFCALAVVVLMIMKSDKLIVKRAEDDPNYKTYDDVRQEKLEKQIKEESEPLPELKNYNKDDKSI